MKENEANGVKWLSVVESAKYLDMSRPRFEALVNAGYIRYYAMPSTGNGGLARKQFQQADLDAFVESRKRQERPLESVVGV